MSNAMQALIRLAIWTVVVVVLHLSLDVGFRRYESWLDERDPSIAARRRTMFGVLRRMVVVIVALIGLWMVLSVFPTTKDVATAFLASGAVLALVAGVALTTPLGNIGSGVLLAFNQPIRIGDRVTVHMERGDTHRGVVEKISLSYTSLITEEERMIFVPNQTMISNVIVNHSREKPRRVLNIRVPVNTGAPIDEVTRDLREALGELEDSEDLTLDLLVGDITESTIWLEIRGLAPKDADMGRIGTEIRRISLKTLAEGDHASA